MPDKPKFNQGDKVFSRYKPGQQGDITGRTRTRANSIYYQVKFSDKFDYLLDYELELVTENPMDPDELIEKKRFGLASDLRRNLTHVQLSGKLSDTLYSMDITKTDFYPHQFKPVLAFLESPSRGLLIADEVGLGKTIEAGLIWTELRARYDCRRVLVVCPAMLREKWRDELRDRFGVDTTIMDAGELLAELKRPDQIPDGKGIICSIQGIRPPRDQQDGNPSTARYELKEFFENQAANDPIIDLVIIDEAHYMRNRSSQNAHLGKLLRDISEHVLLLSATPINLRSDDLFSLLNIVDQDTFADPKFFPEVVSANEPLVEARKLVLNMNVGAQDILEFLNEATNHSLLRDNVQLRHIIERLNNPASMATRDDRVQLAGKIEKVNLWCHVFNRTRKAEVLEWTVVREPKSQFVPLEPVEKEFYDNVTDAVRSYAEDAEISDGFLLASPQRQVSSCLYAAAKAWIDRANQSGDGLNEMVYEDTGEEDANTDMSPLVDWLASEVLPEVDLPQLRRHDSKFKAFHEVINKYLTQHPQEKIVVFSYFRATLNYLAERLAELGIVSQVLMGGMKENKQVAIERFREDKSTKVLLSSEVASEGVDLQFCRMIVNYDLPWNPMKIEQRIGRLDRIGQEADKIVIWNLGHEDTIDQRIYERLFERLGIFERALGGLEAVLGEKIKQLTEDLTSHQLTAQQQADQIDQTAMALENTRQAEDRLEQEASGLIAHGGYILDRVTTAHDLNKRITEQDLIIYIKDYLNEHASGHEFHQPQSAKLRFHIKLPASTAAAFATYIEHHKLRGKTRLATGGQVKCEFINKVNVATRSVEQINQLHPLVRFISAEIKSSSFCPVVAVKLSTQTSDAGLPLPDELRNGQYAFAIETWKFTGLVDEVDLQVRAVHIESGTALDATNSWKLLNAARLRGKDWPEARSDMSDDLGDKIWSCRDRLDDEFREFEKDKKNENEDRINVQIFSTERHRDRQVESHEQVLAGYRSSSNTNKRKLIPATEGRIKKINARFNVKIEELKVKKKMRLEKDSICCGGILLE